MSDAKESGGEERVTMPFKMVTGMYQPPSPLYPLQSDS
jgi:hypothetical protein